MLKFLGRGSAFADEHNCAYFVNNGELVLVDCPATAFQRVKKMDELINASKIYILVTHTHGDHSGGIGTMLQYVWFALKRKITVVAPSEDVKNDLLLLLLHIEGCEREWFDIFTTNEIKTEWLVAPIPTDHVKTLEGKCFGYHLRIKGHNVIYTGDTATLAPFVPFLETGDYLYTETAFYESNVHLAISKFIDEFIKLTEKGINVYLMHMDVEEEIIKWIQYTDIKLAPLKE